MMRVAWISRHDLNEEQLEDLKQELKDNVAVDKRNITFSATASSYDDYVNNKRILLDLSYEYDVLVGVFPPVAIEALIDINIQVLSPVSMQEKSQREDGSTKIDFKHVRYATIKDA